MYVFLFCCFFFFKQKTAYEMRISDWSSDVCSSDLAGGVDGRFGGIMRDERVRILHILPRRDLHHREAYLFKMRCKFIPNCLLICVPRREFPHVKARKQPCLAEDRKSVV